MLILWSLVRVQYNSSELLAQLVEHETFNMQLVLEY